jgi:hypothetical protein
VPFVVYDSRRNEVVPGAVYSETIATGNDSIFVEKGHTLMDQFIKGALG